MRTPSFTRSIRLAAAGAVLVLLAGCASAVGSDKATSGKATDGGTLRVALATDLLPQTIFTNSSDGNNTVIGLVYNELVTYPLDSVTPQPSLATSWSLAKDGRSLTLNLRKGVKFHTGREFTSKDVEFSIKTWADPVWTVQFQRTAAAITGFDTTDPYKIKLTFAHPLSNIFDLLANLPIIDQKTFGDLKTGKRYVGTGPFEFTSWQPNSDIDFTRNNDYWAGKPHLKAVDVKVVTDAQAQVAGLRSHQFDVILDAGNRNFATLKKDGGFDVDEYKGGEGQVYVGVNVANPALKDVRLRQAIAYALDRNRIVKEVYAGVGRAINLPWPQYSPAYDAKLDATYDRNVTKAKALVAQLGTVPTVPLSYPAGNPNYEAVAQIVQSNLAEVGIRTKLLPTEQAQFIKQLIGATYPGLWITNHSYAQYTPSTLAVSAYPFNAAHNASHFSSPAYTKDADAAWQTPDGTGAAATAAYAKVSKDLIDNLFLIEIAELYPEIATGSNVHGITMSKRNELHLADAYLTK